MKTKWWNTNAQPSWRCINRKISKIFNPSMPQSHLLSHSSIWDTLYVRECCHNFRFVSAQMRPNFGPMYSTFHLTIGPWVVGFYISQERCFSFACFVAVVAWRWLPAVVGCIELMFWSKSIQCSQHSSSLLLAKLAGYGDVHNWRHPVFSSL